jgi:hypothetical protein
VSLRKYLKIGIGTVIRRWALPVAHLRNPQRFNLFNQVNYRLTPIE